MQVELWDGLAKHPGQNRFIASLTYSYGLLKIQIEYRELDTSFVLMFRSPTYFRVMDEGDLLRFQSQFNTPIFADSFIFEAFNTELIDFCHREKQEILDKEKYHHYIIATDDDFIDVVTYDDEPTLVAIDL
ncbi:MAG: hypothetical protein ACFHVJ_02160 [Aestuariibacter sp.]